MWRIKWWMEFAKPMHINTNMITFEEAYALVINSIAKQNQTEKVLLINALHRVLATDVKSDIPMPPFNKSAMDGYACRFADRHEAMHVVEVIAAGNVSSVVLKPGECAKIMTGAMIPSGADGVIKIEDTEEIAPDLVICKTTSEQKNICFIGEDIQPQTVLISEGTLIQPQHIAVLAAVGIMEVNVFCKTTVGIISTGNELVEPDQRLSEGKIRNSNGYQLFTQVLNHGAQPQYYGIALDDRESVRNLIKKATQENQITLLSGGVSMGDFDLVPEVLTELGFKTHFQSIAVQPGKPTLFTQKGEALCFGLPGNPVSSFIQFELLVSPLIHLLQGEHVRFYEFKGELMADFHRKNVSRKAWIPVLLNEDMQISLVDYHGSAHINAFVEANAVMEVPIGVSQINKGEKVNVRRIS